jgi:two-component system, cell cycle sensor histidine kinase and response regulator CckA
VALPGNSLSTQAESVSEAELYRNLAENGRDLICQTGATGRYIYASPNHLPILGYSADELAGQSFFKNVHPDDLVSVNRHYVLGLITHQPAHLQFRFRHKNGEWRWLETNGQPIFGRTGRWRATLILRDVTRRRQAEEQMRHATAWRDALLASTTQAVATLDEQGQLSAVGASFCELAGYAEEDLLGHPWLALVTPDEQYVAESALHEILHQHAPRVRCEVSLRDVQGGERRMLFHLAPLVTDGKSSGVVVTGEDLTELRQSEESREYLLEQLQIAQKLESIGKMSAGVAHDFNNVLAGALTTTELLKAELAGRPDLARLLSLQQRAIERASQLTQQLLSFSRHEKIVPGPVDLAARARDILEFCSTQFDKRIEIDNRISPHLPAVLGDACQVDQILLNLLLNAGQALVQVADEGRAPRITLDACAETLDPDIAQRNGLAAGEPMLHLAIHDNGPGIREDVLAQIFDPFFTTKGRSNNHGLGLSTTHGLVKNHRGAIEVDSQPGLETAFHVYLPICTLEMLPAEPVVDSSATDSAPAQAPQVSAHAEHVAG